MIPLLDLKAQNGPLAHELEAACARVLRSGRYVLGEEVEAFEADFARYCGTRHAVAVSTGTAALHMALLAAGIGPGDEVVTTPMTFVATVAAIQLTGARAVLADIEPGTRTLDPAAVAKVLTSRTRAILPVHLHGGMADMTALLALSCRPIHDSMAIRFSFSRRVLPRRRMTRPPSTVSRSPRRPLWPIRSCAP